MLISPFVFRVQDAEGRGPWRPGFSHKWVEDRPDEEFAALIPWPLQFGELPFDPRMHAGCGCQSLSQLRRWFTESEYRTLLGLGYRAVKMTPERILAASDIQCVFERVIPLNVGVVPIQLYDK